MWHGTILRLDYNLFFQGASGTSTERGLRIFPGFSSGLDRTGTSSDGLPNQQGWYCLESKVAVFSEVDIQLDCRASLAFSSGGTTVLGSDERSEGVTVSGSIKVTRIGCNRTNYKR
jgi:hypothetical protein